MEWLSRPTKKLLFEMSIGIVLYNVLLGVFAWMFLPMFSYPVFPVFEGLLVGAVGAVLMLIHMAVTTERALESQNESYASKITVVHSLIRKIVLMAALFFCWRVLHVNLLAVVIGAMGMKAGAYLQPLIHRIFAGKDELHGTADREDTGI
ncbi:MAG: ATP synthase subunit I [Lachnospiraceae bacterium]|nr:ATP synthase subunit I [Lachnospiraceae bacterium]